jgi:hypothetical protein
VVSFPSALATSLLPPTPSSSWWRTPPPSSRAGWSRSSVRRARSQHHATVGRLHPGGRSFTQTRRHGGANSHGGILGDFLAVC